MSDFQGKQKISKKISKDSTAPGIGTFTLIYFLFQVMFNF